MQYLRALVHGESGIGKTTSLGTLPEDRVIVAVGERGAIPLRAKNFETRIFETWGDVQELYTEFRKPVMIGDKPCAVLAVDSLSEISELCKEQIIRVDRKALIKERTRDKNDKPAGIYDDQLTQEDWGVYRSRMSSLISAFCHLPIHVIFTCLSAWTEDRRTGTLHITPNMNGKLALECPAFFDLVLHMEATKDDEGSPSRVWRTYNDGQILAKDASGALAPFEQPSWSYVFKKILNGHSKMNGGAN